MRRWNIYYRDREYAREHGDPLLGVVEARTKEQAERLASAQGLGGTAGVWACVCREPVSNEDLPDSFFCGTEDFSDSVT